MLMNSDDQVDFFLSLKRIKSPFFYAFSLVDPLFHVTSLMLTKHSIFLVRPDFLFFVKLFQNLIGPRFFLGIKFHFGI
jgi:hypothetical protein